MGYNHASEPSAANEAFRWPPLPLRVISVSETPEASASATDFPSPGFRELGLEPALLQALIALGYEVPTAIQAATIPPLLAGTDVLGQALTGTGKTAAFA
jgi:ATP-dependent RNA helicase DeaD